MTSEEYRAHRALNYSRLKWLLQSPAHFQNPPKIDEEKSPEMLNGTMLHAYVLEGRDLEYVVKPEFNPDAPDDPWHGSKKWCKAWKAQQTLPIMDRGSIEDQEGMRNALKNNAVVQEILEACPERETAIITTYKNVEIKALLDLSGKDPSGNRCILDIKTCRDASPRGFAKAVGQRGYALQMAHYTAALAQREGLEQRPGWLWVAVENKRPYNVAIYSPTPEHWDSGARMLDYCIETWLRCNESGSWPGYGQGVQMLPWRKWDEFSPSEETFTDNE